MQTFKAKVLSLITAVCMIAVSAAPVFAAESAADSGTGTVKATFDSGVTQVEFIQDSGSGNAKITASEGTADVPAGDYTVKVTTNGEKEAVKIGDESYTHLGSNRWGSNAKYTVSKGETLSVNVITVEKGTEVMTPDTTITDPKVTEEGITAETTTVKTTHPDVDEVKIKSASKDSDDLKNEINDAKEEIPSGVGAIDTSKIVAIDITAYATGGAEVYVNTPVTVEMNKPKSLASFSSLVAIHYYDGSTNIREIVIVSILSDGKISFTLQGLSPVVLAPYTPASTSGGDIFRPSGSHSSGGSGGGGGGGGGSRYNSSQSLFDKSTSTINGILKNLLTGGKTGSTVTGSTTLATGSAVTKAQADKAAASAISQAKAQGSDSATVLFRNASAISSDVLSSIASQAQKSGLSAYVTVDTVKNGAVDVRLSVLASAAARTGRAVNLSASVGSSVVENHFARYFSNNIKVVSMGQKGSFGTTVEAAVRVNLSNMDTESLRFYTFDAATNVYHEIAQSNYFIDANGYVHFATDMGNYIVITDQPLTLK